ncbi:VRR-NUC domain-containing protein [Halomonas sp. E14]|uniref:VRR-NUC domain-containing protein n=1 Tax=Halomonas sp. E14 TaxID=3397245 RepID=UPI00403E9C54
MNSIPPAAAPTAALDDPYYYLVNFRFVLRWVEARHAALLIDAERDFLGTFARLPQPAQALLVRMVMRKGELFRTARLGYAEIGDPAAALAPLVEAGLVEDDPALSLADLFRLLRLAELRRLLAEEMATLGLAASASKGVLQAALASQLAQVRRLSEWRSQAPGLLEGEQLVRLRIQAHCDRLRLMFFGNLRQDWAEFVLTELGRQRFEPVTFGPESRAFHHRCEVDGYLALHRLRERLEAGEVAATLASEVPAVPTDSSWLQSRRARLCLHLARQAERDGEEVLALTLYQQAGDGPSGLAEARIRRLRLMERRGDFAAAFALAASAESPGEQEAQALGRLLPRLRRRLGLAAQPPEPEPETPRWRLELPRAACVERAVCEHLGRPEAPVVYVENLLLNGLFGLLCWPALFAPLPGAFFHPFHAGPADLYRDDFVSRRRALFETCLAHLDDGSHAQAILATWRDKQGIASPFVHWEGLSAELLERALAAIPAAHLRACFERFLGDLRVNRAGLPDLIQFLPPGEEGALRYRFIEVKGPGDRLQDNQRRWLAHFHAHGIPVAVCHVVWSAALPAP